MLSSTLFDDLGLQPFDGPSRLSLLAILEDRHGRHSTMVISQVKVNQWHELFGEPTIVDAISDRLVHSSHRLDLQGESVRKLYGQRDMENSA